MIGQIELRNRIDTLISKNTFPLFSILSGPKDSGKHTLCNYIANKLNEDIYFYGNSMEEIDRFIDFISNRTNNVTCVLEDIDTATTAVKNAILKCIEEPSKNTHILLLANNKDQLLETIKSRGMIFEISPYSKSELEEYIKSIDSSIDSTNYLKICSYIGEIKKALEVDINELLDFSLKVLTNINKSTLSNSLKISTYIKPNTNGKYDLDLFFNCIEYHLVNLALSNKGITDKYIEVINLIKELKGYLAFKSVNKKFIIDEFIIRTYNILGV